MHAPAADGSLVTIRVSGDELEDALRLFRDLYPTRTTEVTPSGAAFSWQHAVAGDHIMSVRTLRFMAHLDVEAVISDDVVIVWNRSGRSSLTVDGIAVPFAAGMPVVLPSDRPFVMRCTDAAMSSVHLGRAFVERVAARTAGEGVPATLQTPPPRITFDPHRPPNGADLAAWRRVVQEISPVLLDPLEPPDAITREVIAERMARAVLRTFPHSFGPVLDLPAGRETDRLRRAVEFVHQNAHRGIGTAEIAAAADLSPRGLQQSLRRNLDTTPNGLLRAVRLEGAHADLVRGDSGTTTVADIARAWGFGHLGRFSGTYRGRYGELPSETLRRALPRAH